MEGVQTKMTTQTVDIVEFAKNILNKHIFDFEAKTLLNYESLQEWASFNEYIKPSKQENRYLHNIWVAYQEYRSGNFDITKYLVSNLLVK